MTQQGNINELHDDLYSHYYTNTVALKKQEPLWVDNIC